LTGDAPGCNPKLVETSSTWRTRYETVGGILVCVLGNMPCDHL
jgi:hypothetical protein